jgi:integrase
MTHANSRWSYSTGERGRNRVRALAHPKTGGLFLEFADGRKRKRVALGHRDREAAKTKAEDLAAALRRGYAPQSVAPTLATLFDNYVREVTPQKGESKQAHDRRAARLFLEYFGPSRKAASLNRRDWDGFIRWRRSLGDRRKGRTCGVRNRAIEYDLKFLHTVLNWAAGSGLLDRNPLKGCTWPKEQAPKRPVLRHEESEALRSAAWDVHPLFELALLLAHETGHRIGAIRLLKWSDVDLKRGVMRWRASTDKTGFEHESLLTPDALAALERQRIERSAIGDSWLFPAPEDPDKPCSHYLLQKWWRRAERLAGLVHEPGRGFHALRRKFATELKHIPLKDLCALAGWKTPHVVLTCYQTADETTMREALASRKQLRAGT